MKTSVKLATSLLVLAGMVMGSHTLAEDKAEEKTVADGVFTEAQVEAGKAVYDAQCKTCHNMRFYTDTLRGWNNQPLLYLWESMMGTMPADNPGSLMFDEYTNVLAYILHENGFPTGESELDPDAGMADITIVTP